MKLFFINIEYLGVGIKMVFYNIIMLKESIVETILNNVGKLIEFYVEYLSVLYNCRIILLKKFSYDKITIDDIIRLIELMGGMEIIIIVLFGIQVYWIIKAAKIPPEPDKKSNVPVPVPGNNEKMNLMNKNSSVVQGLNSDLIEKVAKEMAKIDKGIEEKKKREQAWLNFRDWLYKKK